MPTEAPPRPSSTLLTVLLLWVAFYASFTLFAPPLLDDADSVHVEVAREMLLRHDYITLYANGIRYLEKAPLLYWSMAGSMKLFMLFGASSPRTLAAAARLPLAFVVLALALVVESLARRMFRSARAGLYAALILLSSFGIFIFTRITIPDAGVCLWIAIAMLCFWRTEELNAQPILSSRAAAAGHSDETRSVASQHRFFCWGFAAACALNVLTKGLIGVVFPVVIVVVYLWLKPPHSAVMRRLREMHPWSSLAVFLAIAAPWHILAGLANPTQGHPAPFRFAGGHWLVPLPTDGNVRGWFWFYFMNEHVLRYLNLRVPHDYDTAPLWLFWGLCLVWMLPWSAFAFNAVGEPLKTFASALRVRLTAPRRLLQLHMPEFGSARLLLLLWAAIPLIFFSLSTRQEYYVLPALPALTILIGGWLARQGQVAFLTFGAEASTEHNAEALAVENQAVEAAIRQTAAMRCTMTLLALGTVFAATSIFFLLHAKATAPNTELAQLLAQNPSDYALSMGHFLDLNARALGLFHVPLALSALSLFVGPLAALLLRKRARPHAANLALAAGAFGLLLAAHLALQIFSPVLTSAQLAETIAPQVHPEDLVAIHGEYESGSTLGFYLKRNDIHILEGRSSNLWYGSFFPDAPPIFETPQSIAEKWSGSQRIFLWQSLTDEPRDLPAVTGAVYVIAKGGGKEIISNQPNK